MDSSVGQHGGEGVRAKIPSIGLILPDFSRLAEELPSIVPATELPRLLGNIYTAKYLANLRWMGKGPRSFKLGRKVVHMREDVLLWLREAMLPFNSDVAA